MTTSICFNRSANSSPVHSPRLLLRFSQSSPVSPLNSPRPLLFHLPQQRCNESCAADELKLRSQSRVLESDAAIVVEDGVVLLSTPSLLQSHGSMHSSSSDSLSSEDEDVDEEAEEEISDSFVVKDKPVYVTLPVATPLVLFHQAQSPQAQSSFLPWLLSVHRIPPQLAKLMTMISHTLYTAPTNAYQMTRMMSGMLSIDLSERDIVKALMKLAWPVSATCLIQNCIALSSTLFVGRLGANEMGGASAGLMLCNIFGLSLGFGFCSNLDALCSQAFGGRRFHLVGLHAQRTAAILTLFCVPIALVYSQTRNIVLLMGIDPVIAELAGEWGMWSILGLWPQLQFEVLKRWLTAQRTVWPVVVASIATVLASIFLNSLFMFSFNLGFAGAACAMALSWWVLLIVMVMCCCIRQRHVMFVEAKRQSLISGHGAALTAAVELAVMTTVLPANDENHEMLELPPAVGNALGQLPPSTADEAHPNSVTLASSSSPIIPASNETELLEVPDAELNELHDCWPPITTKLLFVGWGAQLRLGLPGALSLFLEWGSFEICGTFAALLGSVQLATHSIFVSTVMTLYGGQLGLGCAAASIIGSHLGAKKPRLAMRTAATALKLACVWGIFAYTLVVLGLHTIWGSIFTSDVEVQHQVSELMWPLLCYGFWDSTKCVLMSILRACGRPSITVAGNLVSCYCIGGPLVIIFILVLHYQLMSLWLAMTSAWMTASILYAVILYRTNWQRLCDEAVLRNSTDDGVVLNRAMAQVHIAPECSCPPSSSSWAIQHRNYAQLQESAADEESSIAHAEMLGLDGQ